LDLDNEFDGAALQGRFDKSAWRNFKRMTAEQIEAWRAAYAAEDQALHKANLSGRDLVRWKYQRYAKNYLRCVKGVDESVERLMATLQELGVDDNTIVIYSSDQGFYIGDHGWYDKRWMYEESLKMPFIIKWPGVIHPGSRNANLVQNIDYAPTFLKIAGAPIPDDIQGVSMEPLLRGDRNVPWRDSIYYHYYEYPSVHMVPRHYGIRTDRYKLIYFYHFDEWEFYDLQTDPDELSNLYNDPSHRDKITEMKQRLAALRDKYEDDSNVSEMPESWREAVRAGEEVESPPTKG
jgi:arylsulfatase A-like enzyme